MPDGLVLDWGALAVAIPTLVIAYMVFGLAGFGAALLSAPILAHLMPVASIVPMLALLDIFAAGVGGFRLSHKLAKKEIAFLGPLMVVGSIAGVTLLLTTPPRYMMLALGVFCLAFALYSLIGPAARRHIHQAWVLPAGLLGGMFSSMFASGGPVYTMYLSRRLDDKDSIRGTVTTLIGFATIVRVILFGIAGAYADWSLVWMAAALAPAMLLGTWLGHRVTLGISREQFLRLLYLLLIASGSSLVFRALTGA